MDICVTGVKMPCARTRAWSGRTRRSTRGSWRGTITAWRRRCSPSSTGRSLSFINLCCRSTHTGRMEGAAGGGVPPDQAWILISVHFYFLLLEKKPQNAANGQLEKVVWDRWRTFCDILSLCPLLCIKEKVRPEKKVHLFSVDEEEDEGCESAQPPSTSCWIDVWNFIFGRTVPSIRAVPTHL